jgi:putative addiction module component (TIGR02574 family)
MTTTMKDLRRQVLALPPDKRALLAQDVWDSIEHFADASVEQAWMAEADRRWQQIEQGKVRLVSGSAAMARARAALR